MNNDVLDLENVLSLPIVTGSQRPLFDFDKGEPIEDAVNMDEPEPTPPPAATQAHEPYNPAEEGYMPPRDIAETIVNVLDGLQGSVLPMMLEKKKFTDSEIENLRTLRETDMGSLTSPERQLMIRAKKFDRIVAQIPFDEGEKRRLVDATARYAEETQMRVSPLAGLTMAVSEVVFKRAAYFFKE